MIGLFYINFQRPDSVRYSYGFNGMEREDEMTQGNYDFGARIYDSRLGRWLAVDPLFVLQPGWSPYKSFLDNPNIYQDPEGQTEYLSTTFVDEASGQSYTIIGVTDKDKVYERIVSRGDADAHYYQINDIMRSQNNQ